MARWSPIVKMGEAGAITGRKRARPPKAMGHALPAMLHVVQTS